MNNQAENESLNLNHMSEDIAMNRSQPGGLKLAHLKKNVSGAYGISKSALSIRLKSQSSLR